ncbi:MAG: class I SAM-dependent methyltransferase [Anaerolineales bacterium]|jgi:ubiquinone/menaquinone biosynthesis C-methylase UbiE
MSPDPERCPAIPSPSGLPPALTWALRLAFHFLYNQMAWTYEAVAWAVSLGQWSRWRLCAAPFLQPGTVLEIGHGTGALAADLAEQGWHVIALDLSANMGRIAERRVHRGRPPHPLAAKVHLLRASAFELPFANTSFDNLVSTFPTEYIFRATSIYEARRVLRPGGRWVIVPFAQLAPRGILPRLSGKLFEATGQAPAWDEPLAGVLRSNGFHVDQEILTLPRSYVHVTLATKLE